MDLYISHDKSKRLNIYLFGLFFYTSIRIKERVVNLMIKFGKGVVKHRVLILIVAFALLFSCMCITVMKLFFIHLHPLKGNKTVSG